MAIIIRLNPGRMTGRVLNLPKQKVTALRHRNLDIDTLNYSAYQIIESGVYPIGNIEARTVVIPFSVVIGGVTSLLTSLISNGDPLIDSQVTYRINNRNATNFSVTFRELTPEVKNLKLSWLVVCRAGDNSITTL